jgi:hypothetical protein
MKNKAIKSLGFLTVASLISTSALAQVTVSGYVEAGFMTGSTKGTLGHVNSKSLGGETVITIAGKGKLANGWDYSAYQNIDSDDVQDGRQTTTNYTNGNPLSTRAIVISPSSMLSLFYTFDGVYGGETARTAVPTVTERVGDLTGVASIAEFIDVTSGSHAIGFDLNNVGPKGRLSVAYNPNLDSRPMSTSDGSSRVANTASGYSIGYSVSPGPVTIRAGVTKIDQTQSATAQDATSKTLGATFTQAPFAIGIQRTKNDGTKATLATTSNIEDEVDTVAASFAATKDITLGATYSTMERTGAAVTTKGPDLKVTQLVVAYNLGPVVISGAYEDAQNKATATGTVSGLDSTTTKIKVKANF